MPRHARDGSEDVVTRFDRRRRCRTSPPGVRDTAVRTVNDTSQGGPPPSVTSSDALIAKKRLFDLATQIPADDAPDERMWPSRQR